MTCNYTANGSGFALLFTASHPKELHKGKHNNEVAPVHRPIHVCDNLIFFFGATAPQWAMASSFKRFLDHT